MSPLSIDESSRENFNKILDKEHWIEISFIVENNLKTTGLFNPLDKDAFTST